MYPETYAERRIDAMNEAIVGHLTPRTLDRILADFRLVTTPMPADVERFASSARQQIDALSHP